jgi:hypothetical protein
MAESGQQKAHTMLFLIASTHTRAVCDWSACSSIFRSAFLEFLREEPSFDRV